MFRQVTTQFVSKGYLDTTSIVEFELIAFRLKVSDQNWPYYEAPVGRSSTSTMKHDSKFIHNIAINFFLVAPFSSGN